MSEIVNLALLATTFATLFVIMDSAGTVPVFLALTSTITAKERKRAALQATLVALGVLAAFTIFGQYILRFLNISVAALQLSGGLLLLLVAMELLTGKAEEPKPAGGGQVNVALVPLGTPLLAGPAGPSSPRWWRCRTRGRISPTGRRLQWRSHLCTLPVVREVFRQPHPSGAGPARYDARDPAIGPTARCDRHPAHG